MYICFCTGRDTVTWVYLRYASMVTIHWMIDRFDSITSSSSKAQPSRNLMYTRSCTGKGTFDFTQLRCVYMVVIQQKKVSFEVYWRVLWLWLFRQTAFKSLEIPLTVRLRTTLPVILWSHRLQIIKEGFVQLIGWYVVAAVHFEKQNDGHPDIQRWVGVPRRLKNKTNTIISAPGFQKKPLLEAWTWDAMTRRKVMTKLHKTLYIFQLRLLSNVECCRSDETFRGTLWSSQTEVWRKCVSPHSSSLLCSMHPRSLLSSGYRSVLLQYLMRSRQFSSIGYRSLPRQRGAFTAYLIAPNQWYLKVDIQYILLHDSCFAHGTQRGNYSSNILCHKNKNLCNITHFFWPVNDHYSCPI